MQSKSAWLSIVLSLTTTISWAGGDVRYVATTSPSPLPPFTNWISAAHTIQEALNVSVSGDEIVVTDGVYSVGGAVTPYENNLSNRVVVTNANFVHSVNGPAVTIIKGQFDPLTGGPGGKAVRCAYLDGGATLSGFTLSGGATATNPPALVAEGGGGAFLINGTINNCVIAGNRSQQAGGGIVLESALSLLTHSVISSNETTAYGGGVFVNSEGTVRNCLIAKNSVSSSGGGVTLFAGLLESCTVADNAATNGFGGGLYVELTNVVVLNSIVFGNTASGSDDEYSVNTNIFQHSCATPLPVGPGNIAANPGFLAPGDYHLRSDSPCVNAGTNQAWMVGAKDMDGDSRIRDSVVDMGSDEAFQFMAFLVQRTNGFNSTWDVISNGSFRLQSSTNPVTGTWTNLGSVVTSVAHRVSVTDTNAPPGQRFYRMTYVGP